jgi:hypothetical protein
VLTGGFQRATKLEQSDQGYNDRSEQLMPNVRCWHLADIDFDPEYVCFQAQTP